MLSPFQQTLAPICLMTVGLLASVSSILGEEDPAQQPTTTIRPAVRLDHTEAGDQDDLCFWYHAAEPSQSLVITSDKKANWIAVYDLQGTLLQKIAVTKPGNIDLRHQVAVGDRALDIVAVNLRSDGGKLALFAVDAESRQLRRLDQNDLVTGPNYGVCLYHSRLSGNLFAVTTSEEGTVNQFALLFKGERPSFSRVRHWKIGKCEGAVADDVLGRLYITEEEGGVWELGAEPDQPAPGEVVIALGDHGLQADLEGITLLPHGDEGGWLLVSSQGSHQYFVYERAEKHRFVGKFRIEGAEETDGIDVLAQPLGTDFPEGVFGCHTAATKRCSVLLTSWEKITAQLGIEAR